MTKTIASATLALIATLAAVGPASAAPTITHEKAPTVKTDQSPHKVRDAQWVQTKAGKLQLDARSTQTKIVAQTGSGSI